MKEQDGAAKSDDVSYVGWRHSNSMFRKNRVIGSIFNGGPLRLMSIARLQEPNEEVCSYQNISKLEQKL